MAFMRSELQSTLAVHQSTDLYLFKLQPNPKRIGILIVNTNTMFYRVFKIPCTMEGGEMAYNSLRPSDAYMRQ